MGNCKTAFSKGDSEPKQELKGVETPVDLSKFEGKWYVAVVKPAPHNLKETDFFNLCKTVSIKEKEKCELEVVTTYNKGKADGTEVSIKSQLNANAKDGEWTQQALGKFAKKQPCKVLEVGGAYSEVIDGVTKEMYAYVVFGHSNKKHYWIMSREPQMSHERLQHCIELLKGKEFETQKATRPKNHLERQDSLVKTDQPKSNGEKSATSSPEEKTPETANESSVPVQ